MKANGKKLKQTFANVVGVLQFFVGALLLVGTIGFMLPAFLVFRDESRQLSSNLTAAADALDASSMTYLHSATNLFCLTGAMDDVAVKLVGVSETIYEVGNRFINYGNTDESWYGKILPFTSWFRSSGENLKEVASDVESVSKALCGQSEAIKNYRKSGHEKSLLAMSKTVESLRRAAQFLDDEQSTGRWCFFVCVLGICVSVLFFANGCLLLVVAKSRGAE